MLNVMGFCPIQRAKSNVKIRDIGDSGEIKLLHENSAARTVRLLPGVLCIGCIKWCLLIPTDMEVNLNVSLCTCSGNAFDGPGPSPPHFWGSTPLNEWWARRRGMTRSKHKRRASHASAGFEPAISAIKWPQTYALDRTATGIGKCST